MREEFLDYLDTPETRALSRHACDISEFLMGLHKEHKLLTRFRGNGPLSPETAIFGYNQACHQKALHIGVPGLELVRLIPGLKVVHLIAGCCGVAGTFGMKKRNYDESMALGQQLFKALKNPAQGITCGLSESSTCRLQMEHGAGIPVLHPIEVLARAYGYPPAQTRADSWDVLDEPAQGAAEGHG
jgi:glycerol-3-phosphate dehydrogenase subunit C